MDVASSSATKNSCPCGGYGAQIHPAWAAFYVHVQSQPFSSAAQFEDWWRGNNCPTDYAGRLILPPQEEPCPCGARAQVAA